MKKSLKFKKVLGYFDYGGVIFELEDGRFALIHTDRINASNNVKKGTISYNSISFLRGHEKTKDIPEEMIEKAKKILSDPNSKFLELNDDFSQIEGCRNY